MTYIEQEAIRCKTYTTTGTSTAYVATAPNFSGLYNGLRVNILIHTDNTGSSTLNLNSSGAKTIKIAGGGNLSAGYLQQDTPYELEYNLSQDVWYVVSNMNTTISSGAIVSNIVTGTVTYEDNAQSDIIIPHGLGVIPRAMYANIFGYNSSVSVETYSAGIATYDGSTIIQKTYILRGGSPGGNTYVNSLFTYRPSDVSDSGTWTITAIDSTNVTLSYTFTGAFGATITAPYAILFIG